MKINLLLLLGLALFSSTVQIGIQDTFSKAIYYGLGQSVKNRFHSYQQKIQQLLKKQLNVGSISYPRQLSPEVIEKALLNLKHLLPDTVPMIPFAVAEPIRSSEILFYFGILNSSFRNLTSFSCSSVVQNTVSSSSIGVDLHVNTSSLQGHYELDVSSFDMHLYGDGNYSITTNGTDASFLTNIQIFMDNSFKMTDFIFNISISGTHLTMTSLLGGDASADELTDVLGQKMPAEVATLSELVQQTVNRSVVDFTNNYVASIMSWSNVIALIYDLARL